MLKGVGELILFLMIIAVAAPVSVYFYMARKAPPREKVCGQIMVSRAYTNTQGEIGAYFAIKDKNGNLHQDRQEGVWPPGMSACVEVAK